MKTKIDLLKSFIFEEVSREFDRKVRAKPYDKNLFDDETINQRSILVPDDIKISIKKWLLDMNLE
jgi:hypothetical protein